MITIITGAPGTGKSAAVVSMLRELSKNRPLFVSGIPELKIEHQTLDDPTKWPETVPDGAVIVIDEVQRVWRPRGPGQKVPEDIAALETHRHRGLDFYVITQGPSLIDKNVRSLAGRHVHLRDLGILGRWWYEWPECADNCNTSWKNAPIKKRYRLPKAIFTDYKSASVHVKPVRSVPWMLAVMCIALALVGYLSYRAYTVISAKMAPPKTEDKGKAALQVNAAGSPGGATHATPILIDDRVAWIPRVSAKPESAPAFDHLRVVRAMPVVTAAMCINEECRCLTQQGTNAGLTSGECAEWARNRPFNPYKAEPEGEAAAPGQTKAPGAPASQSSTANAL